MIRSVAALVLTFALALWTGGAVWLFVTVSKLFAVDREMAVRVAPTFFNAFNRYQLALGVVACVAAAVVWRIDRRRAAVIPLACVLAALLFVAAVFFVTGRLETLRLEGSSAGPQFRQLHGTSMVLYLATTILAALALGSTTWSTSGPLSRYAGRGLG